MKERAEGKEGSVGIFSKLRRCKRSVNPHARPKVRDIVPHSTMASFASASALTLGAFPRASGLRRSEVRASLPSH